MVIIEGTFNVIDLELARPHMDAMIKASRAEPGCIEYAYAVDMIEPCLIRVIERWESRAALSRHLQSAHIVTWRESWPRIGVSDRDLRLYEAAPETV